MFIRGTKRVIFLFTWLVGSNDNRTVYPLQLLYIAVCPFFAGRYPPCGLCLLHRWSSGSLDVAKRINIDCFRHISMFQPQRLLFSLSSPSVAGSYVTLAIVLHMWNLRLSLQCVYRCIWTYLLDTHYSSSIPIGWYSKWEDWTVFMLDR
jgi:hypothetical protein